MNIFKKILEKFSKKKVEVVSEESDDIISYDDLTIKYSKNKSSELFEALTTDYVSYWNNSKDLSENVIQTKPLLLRDPATGRFISKKAKNV